MKDRDVSLNRHCPCSQTGCLLRGSCVLCVQNHLDHERHLPEYIQGLLWPLVRARRREDLVRPAKVIGMKAKEVLELKQADYRKLPKDR